MTLGVTPRQADLFRGTAARCEGRVAPDSIYGILHRECFGLFPDEMFADLFTGVGRRSVPPMIVAVVMVLQRIEGLSDREAADRFAFDARWKYAAGGLDFDYPGFAHTVLAGMRARLARSERPGRIFDVALEAARAAGLVGRRRVLDSTPLYDAVATMDTVTLVRSAVRGLLKAAGAELAGELRGVLARDDDYAAAGKPACDWDDDAAREALVDGLARDARAVLGALEGRELEPALAQAAELLAAVTGQDLEEGPGGVFRIARRVAPDRVISTVDPQARHGHKTSARGFDGYDPADFGLRRPHLVITSDASMRTALSDAMATDEDDDSYDLGWRDRLPGDDIKAIPALRQLLANETEPISRHFMFTELETILYRSRDSFQSALDEYDVACQQHDAEIGQVREALLAKWGKLPLIDTYRQMAIRQQKAGNHQEALWWAERGIAVYGDACARPEFLEDLQNRAARYRRVLHAR
jgi:hypothetical protein